MQSESNMTSQTSGITYEHPEFKDSESVKTKFAAFKGLPDLANKIKTGTKSIIEQEEPPEDTLKNLDVTSWKVERRNVFKLEPKQNKTNKHVLFLHGGAYVSSIMKFHWPFFEILINETKHTFIVPDYPLAPDHTYQDSFRFIDPIYRKLISEVDPKDIVIMGDSAGGGFALGLAQKIKNDGLPQPSQIILLSPWLDITASNPEMKDIEKDDAILTVDILQQCAESYTKGGDINSYLVRPINGPLEGLAKISLFIGTHDILYADAKKFKEICDQKGIGINYYVYPKMMHNWAMQGFPESDFTIQQLKNLLQ